MPITNKQWLRASTPVDITALDLELTTHPDRDFVTHLISGLTNGFHTGVTTLPRDTYVAQNLLSACNQANVVSIQLEEKVRKGYMIGPFNCPPFPEFRCSPLGVVDKKYSKKINHYLQKIENLMRLNENLMVHA